MMLGTEGHAQVLLQIFWPVISWSPEVSWSRAAKTARTFCHHRILPAPRIPGNGRLQDGTFREDSVQNHSGSWCIVVASGIPPGNLSCEFHRWRCVVPSRLRWSPLYSHFDEPLPCYSHDPYPHCSPLHCCFVPRNWNKFIHIKTIIIAQSVYKWK